MRLTGSEAIAKVLEEEKIEIIFGIPGVQNLELYDVLSQSQIRLVVPTSESAAVFMADAYSRTKNRTGVAVVVPGPGMTYALTGIGEAFVDNIPLIVIVSAPRSDSSFAFQLHQMDQKAVLKPVSLRVEEPERGGDVYSALKRAFFYSQYPPKGPCAVIVPSNLFMDKSEAKEFKGDIEYPFDEKALSEVAKKIDRAKRVGIYAGYGVAGAEEELRRLAEKLSAPVSTTLTAKGILPENHPLSCGFGFGPSGTTVAEKMFSECDLVIALGVRFSEVGTGSYGLPTRVRIVHIDGDPTVPGKNVDAELACISDAKLSLTYLLEHTLEKEDKGIMKKIEDLKKKWDNERTDFKKTKRVHPGFFLYTLRRKVPADTIITTDAGAHMFWVVSHFDLFAPRCFLSPVDYQAMGYSVPSAVGASIINSGRKVIGVVGDGGFLMTGMECLTAVREGSAPVIVVFNDGHLGLIKEFQNRLYRRIYGVEIKNPDFEQLAVAFGMDYIRIETNDEVESSTTYIAQSKSPLLVDVNVDYNEMTRYIKGAVWTNIKRASIKEKLVYMKRFIGRTLSG